MTEREQANTWAQTAAEGFAASAVYLRSVPEAEWGGPTGAEKWTLRYLAGHIVGEAVWFPNLVRGVTRGEEPYPMDLYDRLNVLPPDELAGRLQAAAEELAPAVAEATDEQLQEPLDLGWARLPLWQATFVSAMEGVLHGWDTRARREQNPTIRREWAVAMVPGMTRFARDVAHQKWVAEAPGTYLLEVRDGVGPITVTAQGGKLTVEPGGAPNPDITAYLDADQYVRLIAGRFPLTGAGVRIEGDASRAGALNRIFRGIANGD